MNALVHWARMNSLAMPRFNRARLNGLAAGGGHLFEQSEGDHVALAPYCGGQAGNGWSGLRDGLDGQRPSRARDHRCGLDSWDLVRLRNPKKLFLGQCHHPTGTVSQTASVAPALGPFLRRTGDCASMVRALVFIARQVCV